MPAIRLITWNLAGRVSAAQQQVAALVRRHPDVVACQEVRRTSLDRLRDGFKAEGFECVDTVPPRRRTGPRALGLLIASRHPLTKDPLASARAPWPERLLGVEVAVPGGGFRLLNVGVPPGATNAWTKIGTIEACLRVMAEPQRRPLIGVGDFNAPQEERRDGRIVTWGQTIRADGTVGLESAWVRWDLAERALFEGGSLHRLRDAYRNRHGFGRRAHSWYWRSGQRRIGRRFDHCFVGPEVAVKACEYLHVLSWSLRHGELRVRGNPNPAACRMAWRLELSMTSRLRTRSPVTRFGVGRCRTARTSSSSATRPTRVARPMCS